MQFSANAHVNTVQLRTHFKIVVAQGSWVEFRSGVVKEMKCVFVMEYCLIQYVSRDKLQAC